jgi:DtxR family Mn-dependent transcriptional regulator
VEVNARGQNHKGEKVKLTISKEDYLKAIAEAEAEEGSVIAATIARWLSVTPPAVALALRRLCRDKLVDVDRKGRIALTKAGREVSDKLRFRHHLIERMLHEILGMEWYKVHDEAERLEHSISEDLERRLLERLGPNGACPHGNQINKSAAERRKLGLQQLWDAAPGSSVRVESMYERDRRLLEYFDGLGIQPGVDLKVVSRNYDGTLTLRLGKNSVNLGESAARRVWVSHVSR